MSAVTENNGADADLNNRVAAITAKIEPMEKRTAW